MFDCKEEDLHFHQMLCKPAGMTQISRSEMFNGDRAVKEVWRHRKNVSHRGMVDVDFMQKTAKTISAGYASLE